MFLAFCDSLLTGYEWQDIFRTFLKFTRRYSNCTPHTLLRTIAVRCDFYCNLASGSRRAAFLAQDTIQWRLILSYVNDAWGAGWLCKKYSNVSIFLVTDCDRVLTDVIQCGPETIFPGNHLCARRRTGLTHMFSFFAYFLLFAKAFKVNSSFWSISSASSRKYNPVSLYFRIYLRSPVLMSSCRRLWQTLNNFIVAHYPSCRSKITGLSLWVWLGC
jgi:hypothetical protein